MQTSQRSPAHASATTGVGGMARWRKYLVQPASLERPGPQVAVGMWGEPQGCSTTTNPLWGGYVGFVCAFLLASERKMPETVLVRSQGL